MVQQRIRMGPGGQRLDPLFLRIQLNNSRDAQEFPVNRAQGVGGGGMHLIHKGEEQLRDLAAPAAAAQPLGEAGHRGRGADLHHLVQGADVDAQLQGDGGAGDQFFLRRFHFVLRMLPQGGGHIAVMDPVYVRGVILQRQLAQMGHHQLDFLPGIGEHNGLFVQGHTVEVFVMGGFPLLRETGPCLL